MNQKLANYLTPIVALFFVAALGVTASTTIGTDITTGGNLDVTGNATVTGTLGVTATTTLGSLQISDVGGFPTIDSGGDTVDLKIDNTGGGDILLEATGGGEVALSERVRLVPVGIEPVACGAGTSGTILYNDLFNYLCVCDGTNFMQVASTTQFCSFSD